MDPRRFLYDGATIIAEYDNEDDLVARYVHGPAIDEPIVWYDGDDTSGRRWLTADQLGSVIAVTDGSGDAIDINTYGEYGAPGGANAGLFQYTGQAWLREVSLYHYKARAYSPTLGRFLQTDPILFAGGMNLYAYVANDPVNFIDPMGLDYLFRCFPVETGDVISSNCGWVYEPSPFALALEYFTGTGPTHREFDERSPNTQDLRTAPGIERARERLCKNYPEGITEGAELQTSDRFGVDDLFTANTFIEQYVGSYNIRISVRGGSAHFEVTNTSSFTSLAYGTLFPAGLKPPNWERSEFVGPLGNTRQTFRWSEPLPECDN